MVAKYLFDEDTQGVGISVAAARNDVWVIGHKPCPIKKGTADEGWFAVAARKRLIVFRKDRDILDPRTAEGRLWRMSKCQGFVFVLQDQEIWTQLTAVIRHWERIENHVRDRGKESWVAKLSASGVQPA
ncbi:MAG TPA: hypothetical protein VM848_10065 [Acidimicrobiia bacterium]|nr:hypothetical protein [Acidimicrobiia bacterium]